MVVFDETYGMSPIQATAIVMEMEMIVGSDKLEYQAARSGHGAATVTVEAATLLLIRRLRHPIKQMCLGGTCQVSQPTISRVLRSLVNAVYPRARQLVTAPSVAIVLDVIERCGIPGHVGSLDGKAFACSRPTRLQGPMWSGYHCGHALVFQGISLPKGLF